MQPTIVTINSTVHEYVSGASPRSGARTTSTAANSGLITFELSRDDADEPPARQEPRAKVSPAPTPPPAGKGLAVGVTEFNPNLVDLANQLNALA